MRHLRIHLVRAFLAAGVAVVLLLVLPACGRRAPPATDAPRNAAEADAGVQAIRELLGDAVVALLGEARAQAIEDVLAGAAAHARATAGAEELPDPTWTPQRILADPAGYRAAGEEAETRARGGAWKAWAWGALGLLAPFAIAALRYVPYVGPVVAPIAEGYWRGMATRRQKDADKRQAVLAQHTTVALQLLVAAAPDQARDLLGRLPKDVADAARAAGIIVPPAPVPEAG